MNSLEKTSIRPITKKLLNELSSYDSATFDHCINVAFIASQMCHALTTEESLKLDIIAGALLHDIGKIFVSKSILTKKEELTEDEWHILRSHSYMGYELISKYNYSQVTKDIVLLHHARKDGNGYPGYDGKIEWWVDIVTIADIYSAATENRVYKKTKSKQEIMKELRSENFDNIYLDILEKIIYV